MNNPNPGIQNDQDKRASFDIGKTKIYAPFDNSNDFFHLLAENARDLIFHSSPDIMAVTSLRDGKYIEVNDS